MSDPQTTPINEPPRAEELLELLDAQHGLYRELRRLAQAQRDLIAAEDPSALLNLLSQRQRLIDRLAAINQRLEPVRGDWKRIEAMLTTEQRRRAAGLVDRVGQLLAEILRTDEADSKTLSARKESAGRQVQTTTAVSQAQAAYRRAAAPLSGPSRGAAGTPGRPGDRP